MATNSTKSTPSTFVTGWVEKFFFNGERRYGFVSSHIGTVHIHADNCRQFSGTPEAPVIGEVKVPDGWLEDNLAAAFPGRRLDYSYVVMQIGQGRKGAYATRWAVIPRRHTVADVLRYGGLDAYIGMEIGVMPVSTKVSGGTWGVLDSWRLDDNRIELTLSSAKKSGGHKVTENSGVLTKVVVFDYFRVTDDTPSQLTLRIKKGDDPAQQVVCWHRPPLA